MRDERDKIRRFRLSTRRAIKRIKAGKRYGPFGGWKRDVFRLAFIDIGNCHLYAYANVGF